MSEKQEFLDRRAKEYIRFMQQKTQEQWEQTREEEIRTMAVAAVLFIEPQHFVQTRPELAKKWNAKQK